MKDSYIGKFRVTLSAKIIISCENGLIHHLTHFTIFSGLALMPHGMF